MELSGSSAVRCVCLLFAAGQEVNSGLIRARFMESLTLNQTVNEQETRIRSSIEMQSGLIPLCELFQTAKRHLICCDIKIFKGILNSSHSVFYCFFTCSGLLEF